MPSNGGVISLCPTIDDLQRHRNPQQERLHQRLSLKKHKTQHAKQRHAPFLNCKGGTTHEKDRRNQKWKI